MNPLDDVPGLRADVDKGRGTALVVSGALMVLLSWLIPYVAPVAVAAYGLYQLYRRQAAEGPIALAVAVLLWFLRVPLGAMFWFIGALMAGFGLFFIIRGMRT